MAYGKIAHNQIRSTDRQGDGTQFQMFGGGATVSGNAAVFDGDGNVIDGGVDPGGYTELTACWVLGRNADVTTGTGKTNPLAIAIPVTSPATAVEFIEAYAIAGVAPQGADLVIDINLEGTSIFGASKLTIPDGSGAMASQSAFASPAPTAARGEVLTLDVDGVGSTAAGQDVTVVLRMRY